MDRTDAYMDVKAMEKTVMIGSILSSVALFALSVVVVMMIGFFLGALALTEKIAQQCSDDEEQYTGQLTAEYEEKYEEVERYEGVEAGVLIPQQAFSQAA